jgi:competence protein ComFB
MAKLTNYNEKLVKEELEKILQERDDVCKCRSCKIDIMAYALNQLPPRYVASDGGHIHTMVNISSDQLKAQTMAAIVNAIKAVAKKPRHGLRKGLNIVSRK